MTAPRIDPTPEPSRKQLAIRAAAARARAAAVEAGLSENDPAVFELARQFQPEEERKLGLAPSEGLASRVGGGLMKGLGKAGTGIPRGLGYVIGGETGQSMIDFANRTDQETADFYDENRNASGTAEFIGRALGEGGLAMATGLGAAGLASKLPGAAGRVGKAAFDIQRAGAGSLREIPRLVGANVGSNLPLDIALGAGRAQETGKSAARGIAEEVAMDIGGTGVLGAAGVGLGRLFGKGKVRGSAGSTAPEVPAPMRADAGDVAPSVELGGAVERTASGYPRAAVLARRDELIAEIAAGRAPLGASARLAEIDAELGGIRGMGGPDPNLRRRAADAAEPIRAELESRTAAPEAPVAAATAATPRRRSFAAKKPIKLEPTPLAEAEGLPASTKPAAVKRAKKGAAAKAEEPSAIPGEPPKAASTAPLPKAGEQALELRKKLRAARTELQALDRAADKLTGPIPAEVMKRRRELAADIVTLRAHVAAADVEAGYAPKAKTEDLSKPVDLRKPKKFPKATQEGMRPFNPETDPDLLVPDGSGQAPLLAVREGDKIVGVMPNPKFGKGGGPAEARPFPRAGSRSDPLLGKEPELLGQPRLGGRPASLEGRPPEGGLNAALDENRLRATAARQKPSTTSSAKTEPYTSPRAAIEEVHQRGQLPRATTKVWMRRKLDGLEQAFRRTFQTMPGLKDSPVRPKEVVGTGGETRNVWQALDLADRRRVGGLPRSSFGRGVAALEDVLADVKSPDEADLLFRKVFVDSDLESLQRGEKTVMGLTREEVEAEAKELGQELTKHPQLAEAYQRHHTLINGIRQELEALGFLPAETAEFQNRRFYMHRMIMDYVEEGGTKLGSKFRKGPGLSTARSASLKLRRGSYKDYVRDYVTVMSKYLTETFEQIDRYKIVRGIGLRNDARVRPRGDIVEHMKTWKPGDAPPPGYVQYNIRTGFERLRGASLAERMGSEYTDDLIESAAKTMGVNPNQLRRSLDLNTTRDPDVVIIPSEVADELQWVALKANKPGLGLKAVDSLGRFFKNLALNANIVRRVVRDFSGDAQRAVAQFGFQPLADNKLWRETFEDVWNHYAFNRASHEMELMQRYLVVNSGRIVSEIQDVHKLGKLRKLAPMADFDRAVAAGADGLTAAFRALPKAASFREDLFRVYLFKMNYQRLLRGQSPLTGIVDPKQIEALIEQGVNLNTKIGIAGEDPFAQAAAEIARRSLIDYGDFTLEENVLRQSIFPFYAWAKGNTKFWGYDLPKAIARGNVSTKDVLSGAAVAGTSAALRGTAMVLSFMGAARYWNNHIMGEAEDRIPTNIQHSNHIILPDPEALKRGEFKPWYKKDETTGKERVVSINIADAADDFMRWVGMDGVPSMAIRAYKGQVPWSEFAHYVKENMLYAEDVKAETPIPGMEGIPFPSVARGVGNLLGPAFTIGATGAFGTQLFPDPLNARQLPPEERKGAAMGTLALTAVPFAEQILSTTNPEALTLAQPNMLTDPARSAGLREVTLTNYGPSWLQDMRIALSNDIRDYQQTIGRYKMLVAGESKRQMSEEDRAQAEKRLKRVLHEKFIRLSRKRERFFELQRKYGESTQ